MSSDPLFSQWLTLGLTPRIAQMERQLIADLAQRFEATAAPVNGREPISDKPLRYIDFIKQLISDELRSITSLRHRYAEYNRMMARAVTEEERQQLILELARDLGAGKQQLAGDRRAFKRWFGADVVVERYQRRLIETERKVAFALERMGVWASQLLTEHGALDGYRLLWRRLDIEPLIKPLLAYDGDSRVRIAAFKSLAAALRSLPQEQQQNCISEGTLQYVFRASLEHRQQTWIQTEAVSLLATLSPSSLATVLQRRLSEPGSGDDLFVRRRCVRLLCEHLARLPALAALLEVVLKDPSPAVRQSLAHYLALAPFAQLAGPLQRLACADSAAEVRAMALLQLATLATSAEGFATAAGILKTALAQEQESFVLRVGLKVARDVYAELIEQRHEEQAGRWLAQLLPSIETLHQSAASLMVRRWAAQTREAIWCQTTTARRTLYRTLRTQTQSMTAGRRRRVKGALFGDHDEQEIGRVMSVLAQQDYGLDLAPHKRRPYLTRGHLFGFRSWRLWHELRRPATDKRQGFSHTTGRIFKGTVRAPSAILSELAETKVPGEPLMMSAEAGWRPYLPLLDEVISCIDEGIVATPVRFYSSEGVTELMPPRSFAARLKARTILTHEFARYAAMRNWDEGDQANPNTYLKALRRLGFEVSFSAYPAEPGVAPVVDPAVQRFFPVAIPFADTDMAARLQDYFFSVYENSLTDLALFLGGMGLLFGGRHLYINHKLRQARHQLPLVVGGWGTRGKSGTERLKAALFNGMGYGVVSKTTGCEAMFLHAPAYGKLREMFLFRPYDKATIWEQGDVMRLSARLGVEVFLWECMALTPSYVSVLQQEWVRDDISTITNTYPDHEDLQGPAGINIPEVMTNFIPRQSLLLTSEEQMLPILRTEADKKRSRLVSVGWLEAGLIPSDMLSRFPYEEHPYNIALVLSMADELGVEHDYALKEMADRVVADLGVLKAYPIAELRGRRLEFVMGMSANERFGCLNNWQRMGFADQQWQQEPGVWLTTVVNNRADRVARSQVFAGVLVEDLSADRHFLIGTNLEGLMGYIKEAWQRYAAGVSLWPESKEAPLAIMEQMALRMRIPFKERHVTARLRVMLESSLGLDDVDTLLPLWNDQAALAEALARHDFAEAELVIAQLQGYAQGYREYQAFCSQLATVGSFDQTVLEQFHALLWRWFERKLVVVEDPHTSGDEIINLICNETPMGLHNRIMGVQNIKGTGLDYVYRWQAWQTCHQACTDLESDDGQVVAQGLRTLVGFQEYGPLSEAHVRQTVERVRQRPVMQSESRQAELEVILSSLSGAMKKSAKQTGSSTGNPLIVRVATALEALLDAGDAVKRRKIANTIYRDLADQRISHERAALELQVLNKRQKGGWFIRQVKAVTGQTEGGG